MRKAIILLCIITGLLSCEKDVEPDVKYQLNITVNAWDAVKDLRDDATNVNLFPSSGEIRSNYGEVGHVRIQLFVYDETGSLFDKEDTWIVDNFAQTVTCTKVLPAGEYTLVATADVVMNTGERIDIENWSFGNISQLKNLKIKDNSLLRAYYKALGVYKGEISLNKLESMEVRLKPAGSLVTVRFKNVAPEQVSLIGYAWVSENDYYVVHNGQSNILKGYWETTGDINETLTVRPDTTGYVASNYFLPLQSQTIYWATFTGSSYEILNGDSIIFDVRQGENLLIMADAKEVKTTVNDF
jgi:hypothetical protein